MSPAGSAQPRPARAYAHWLDSLTRAGWDAGPAAERVPVADALARVSAAPVVARWPSPRSDCSAMDGIAVRAARLTGRADAGPHHTTSPDGDRDTSDSDVDPSGGSGDRDPVGDGGDGRVVRLAAGMFEWIDTGDPMPAGADTVVIREWVLPQADGSVTVIPAVPRGKNVRRVGEDFAAGDVLVPAGRRLRPGDLAAAAAGGHASLLVARPPVVAIIPTGDEIRPPGSTARPGEILDTNSLMQIGRAHV